MCSPVEGNQLTKLPVTHNDAEQWRRRVGCFEYRTASSSIMRRIFVLFFTIFSFAVAELDVEDQELLLEVGNVGRPSCDELLETFANASSMFTYCAIKHARPITICEDCVGMYQQVWRSHGEILKLEDESGKACKEELMNLDRLEVIEEGFGYITDLWTRADCSYCFNPRNDSGDFILSDSTKKFIELHNATNTCIEAHHMGNHTYNDSVCQECETTYCAMNQFYDTLKESQSSVCMDIVDLMNITRMKWSDTLSCMKSGPKLDPVLLLCSSIMAVLPVVFYLIARFSTTEIRNKLQTQKRLAEELRHSSAPKEEVDQEPGPSLW